MFTLLCALCRNGVPLCAFEQELIMPSASSITTNWSLVDNNGIPFRLPRTMVFLGREECDISLKSRSVDKRHAVITYDHYQNKFKLKDLSSVNGTFVNDHRIPDQVYIPLENEDTIRFGYDSTVFRLERITGDSNPVSDLSTSEAVHTRPIDYQPCLQETTIKLSISKGHPSATPTTLSANRTFADDQKEESDYDKTAQWKSAPDKARGAPESLTDLYVDEALSGQDSHAVENTPQKSAKSQIKLWEERLLDNKEVKMADSREFQKAQTDNVAWDITRSPERPDQLDLLDNNNEDYVRKSKCTYMEISHLADDTHLVPSGELKEEQANVNVTTEAPGTAFTVTLDGDDNAVIASSPVSANLSNFLPSKIRRSFRERAASRKEKESEKEDVSPTRQKKIDDLWNSSMATGQKDKRKQRQDVKYASDGQSGSDGEDDRSSRSEGPPSTAKRKSAVYKSRETKAQSKKNSAQMARQSNTYLIDKMLESSKENAQQKPTREWPPTEHSLYKEARSHDYNSSAGMTDRSMPPLQTSLGVPDVAGRLCQTGVDRSPVVSPAGTYTIEDEPEEVTQARRSIEQALSESVESSATLRDISVSSRNKEYDDSLDEEDDEFEEEVGADEVTSSLQVEVGDGDYTQSSAVNVSENAPKWVTQWASLTARSTQATDIQGEPSRTRMRPGTGRKLPNPPVQQSCHSEVSSSVGSESSTPSSPQNLHKVLSDNVFMPLAEPQSKRTAMNIDTWNVNTEESSRSSWRRYKREAQLDCDDTARSTSSVDTDVLLQDTETVMAVMSQKRVRETTFTKTVSRKDSNRQRGNSDCEQRTAKDLGMTNNSKGKDGSNRISGNSRQASGKGVAKKSFPLNRTDSREKNATSQFGSSRQSREAFSDVTSETDGADNVSVSSESSVAMSEDTARFKRQGSKGKGPMSMTRPNRAFALRRAKAEEEEKSSPKTRSRSNSYSSCSDRGLETSRTEASLGTRIVKKSQENNKSSFSRGDGGRHSLRLNRVPPVSKSVSKPTVSKSVVAPKSGGNRSQPGSRSSSPKSQEWNAWERRKGYDPRRAVAEAKAKAKKTSCDGKEVKDVRQSLASGDHNRERLSADTEELGSSHSREIAQMSSALARDMETLSSRDGAEGSTGGLSHSSTEELVRNLFNTTSMRSAFSAPRVTRSPSPLKSPPTPLTPGQLSAQAQITRLENGVTKRKEWDKCESYDHLIVSSLHQLSSKLLHSSGKVIGKLRESHSVSKTPSPVDELLNLPSHSEIPGWKSANQELASVLRNLRKVEHHLQVMDRVITGQSEGVSVLSTSSGYPGRDQSLSLEHITKIRNEKVAFRPIDNPSSHRPWKSSVKEKP